MESVDGFDCLHAARANPMQCRLAEHTQQSLSVVIIQSGGEFLFVGRINCRA